MAGQIIEVDPSTLTIALNVRADAKLDKEFVASIRELGVLQPPMVVANADGGYDVVLGQRRTLAAIEAKHQTIPVYLVEKDEADAARIIDQLTENEQRQQLSDVDRVRGYKELALFGISPAQIAKRTATPRARVDAALAVAGSEVATAVLTEFQITLDQAAEIVEFEADAKAVKRLRDAAEHDPGKFKHIVKELRDEREFAAAREVVEAQIKDAGYELLKYSNWGHDTPQGYSDLHYLAKPDTPRDAVEPTELDKAIVAGRAQKGWDGENHVYVCKAQYFVRDDAEHGLVRRQFGAPSTLAKETKEERTARLEREARFAAERAEREARQAAKAAAAEVRKGWIAAELLQRKPAPDLLPLVAQLALEYFDGGEYVVNALEVVGIEIPEFNPEVSEIEFVAGYFEQHPELSARFLLGQVIAMGESRLGYYEPDGFAAVYLRALEGWGYGLSDFEHGIAHPVPQPESEPEHDEAS